MFIIVMINRLIMRCTFKHIAINISKNRDSAVIIHIIILVHITHQYIKIKHQGWYWPRKL